jgi:hypothetical protein
MEPSAVSIPDWVIWGGLCLLVATVIAAVWDYVQSRLRGPAPTRQQPVPRREETMDPAQTVAEDVIAVSKLGWPYELRRLRDGRLCLILHLGEREGLPVDAFVVLACAYPARPPRVVVACGRQRLPITLPSLAGWSTSTSLADLVREVVAQVPGLSPNLRIRLTPEGDLR